MNQLAATISSDYIDVITISDDGALAASVPRTKVSDGVHLSAQRVQSRCASVQDTKVSPDYAPIVDRSDVSTQAMPGAVSVNLTRMQRAELSLAAVRTLVRLASRLDGWRGPGSKALDSESLSSFLEFWALSVNDTKRKEPSFSLAPNGNLVAEWHRSNRKHLDIEYQPDGSVFFGLFSGVTNIDGQMKWKSLASMLMSLDQSPFRWSDA